MMVIGAHAADFVWRAGGALALSSEGGGAAAVLALSYGERGESGELWKEEGQTIERVKAVRAAEASRAAAALGAEFQCLDLGDYPLEIDGDALGLIADRIREFAPDVLVTHTDTDPFNPDHPVASALAQPALGGAKQRLPLKVLPDLPAGIAGIPAGLTAARGNKLPAWSRIERVS